MKLQGQSVENVRAKNDFRSAFESASVEKSDVESLRTELAGPTTRPPCLLNVSTFCRWDRCPL